MGVCVCVVCACAWVRVWVCVVGDERGRVLLGDNVCFLVRLACLLTELFELKSHTHILRVILHMFSGVMFVACGYVKRVFIEISTGTLVYSRYSRLRFIGA